MAESRAAPRTLVCAAQVRILANAPDTLWDTEQPQSAHVFEEREFFAEPRFDTIPSTARAAVGQALTAAWDGLDWTAWRRLLEPPVR